MASNDEQRFPRWLVVGVVVPLVVALIGALAAVAAAIVGRNGGDARTATTAAHAAVVPSAKGGAEVRACAAQHQMSRARETIHTVEQARSAPPYTTSEGEVVKDDVTIFKRCDWPPPDWADPDGYSEIRATSTFGPQQGSSTDADYADIIKSSCSLLEVSYSTVAQGYQDAHRPAVHKPNTVVYWYGKRWPSGKGLPFIYERDELVVLRNERTRLDSVRCVK